jgi:RNA polymerase sigma factor (TIGR02999 family)
MLFLYATFHLCRRGASTLASPIAQLIRHADAGDGAAADQLFAALYRELHAIAERQLHRGGSELSLGTTTLLHEAYLNIRGREGVEFPDRNRFLAYAARAMRGLMIDYARRSRTRKRGGHLHLMPAWTELAAAEAAVPTGDLEQLGAALDRLARVDAELAQLVDLHFFGGFSLTELAELRGVSRRTVQRDWTRARLLLHRMLQD